MNTSDQVNKTGPDGPVGDQPADSFEGALKELEKAVQALEDGDQTLQQTLELYERGTRLLKHCHLWLSSTEQRIEQISKQADGTVEIESWEPGTPVREASTRASRAVPNGEQADPAPMDGPDASRSKEGLDPEAFEGELPF